MKKYTIILLFFFCETNAQDTLCSFFLRQPLEGISVVENLDTIKIKNKVIVFDFNESDSNSLLSD
jgi:hypothetical protein